MISLNIKRIIEELKSSKGVSMEDRLVQRENNLELLRIVSMLMIITMHIFYHGGVIKALNLNSNQYFFVWILEGFCYVSVNCYILISGYFLLYSDFKINKVFELVLVAFIYSVSVFSLLAVFGLIKIEQKDVLVIFPVLSKQYWFVTIYIGMYVLSPFINKLLLNIDKQTHFSLIILLSLLFSVWPNIFFFSDTLAFGGGYGVVWFITLYIVGAFIRRFYNPSYKVVSKFLYYIFFASLVPLSKIIFIVLFKLFNNVFFINKSEIFYYYNSIFVYLASIFLFILFLNLKIRNKQVIWFINVFSPLSFGIYLLHDNLYLRSILWPYLNVTFYLTKVYFPIYVFVLAVLIYLLSSIVEMLRLFIVVQIKKNIFKKKSISIIVAQKIEKLLKNITDHLA